MNRCRRITFILSVVMLLPMASCEKSPEDQAFDDAYKANFAAAHQKAFQEGEERGTREGTARGQIEAEVAAANGRDWTLYRIPGAVALSLGLTLGLTIQYTILLLCRRSGRLPQLSTVAFVPAMKSTVAYSIFKRRRDVMLEIDEQLREMGARKKLQVAKIRQLKEAIALKVNTLSSIEELRESRILELAEAEMEKIVSRGVRQVESGTKEELPSGLDIRITHVCPFCQQLIRFRYRSANTVVNCPNKECGQPIRLPPVTSGKDGSPMILDINEQ